MAGKRKNNPAGSTNGFRGDVLRVLGVLKVATADQIQRIGAPHLSFRHTDKKTLSEQKTARTASHTGALSDMRKHNLAENGGSTETGERLRNLTAKGLEAASYELRHPVTEMGSTARGAGSSGASHPMAVNETVIAMLRPKPNLAKLADDPAEVRAAAQAAVDAPPGIGTIASYWTEVPLPATGTWNAPGKGGAQADIVLTAPQDQVPLLFIEVDNCHETAEELADKLEKYARFFRRRVKDTDGRERPMWRTRWTAPATWSGDATHPPVLLVFNHIGERNPNRTVPRLSELTRHLWQGERQKGGYHHYDGRIPIIATGLQNLREHGPAGPVFLRFGRDHMQPLREAIGNPRREAADARAREEAKVRQDEYQAQVRRVAQEQAAKKAAEREARRPVCTGCGARFTDERWEAAHATDWGAPKDTHPHLCDDCKQRAVAAEGQAVGAQAHPAPVRGGAEQQIFQREARRPVCTDCGATFTDERWKAIERVGWGVPPEPRPSLCEDCDRRFVTDVQQAWPDEHRHQEQGQALPEQKAGGTWLSRFRR
ncbi:replication-relaxation family protein [Streptomyces sp. NBC_00873]|uniref:replication-relaxation family protein n=1 Tax=unclassified Streptomyces TaxID=2593676 RepID=UPI0038670FB8|nr:replication-relaxation family protein [Streptomyces sp. NBC_00873]WSY96913.1 replication-relaxation family protein [Streptomyces sp. NBC_00873]WTA41314.1 replication-relaxation family protein [Streptomyces sp. NBC_00842]WTA48583.1 replication-relaxation family protein [Streptomyces sp. NBC_00842]